MDKKNLNKFLEEWFGGGVGAEESDRGSCNLKCAWQGLQQRWGLTCAQKPEEIWDLVCWVQERVEKGYVAENGGLIEST